MLLLLAMQAAVVLAIAFLPSAQSWSSTDPNLVTRRDALLSTSTAAAAVVGTTSSSSLWLPPSVARADDTTAATSPISATKIPTVRLGGGTSSLEISRTIQGYWQLAGGHGRYTESDALNNMKAHYDAGVTTLDTADIYGPSEIIIGKFMKTNPKAIPCTKFCCFRFLEDITREEVKLRIQKVRCGV